MPVGALRLPKAHREKAAGLRRQIERDRYERQSWELRRMRRERRMQAFIQAESEGLLIDSYTMLWPEEHGLESIEEYREFDRHERERRKGKPKKDLPPEDFVITIDPFWVGLAITMIAAALAAVLFSKYS